jgi:hypothetical protein
VHSSPGAARLTQGGQPLRQKTVRKKPSPFSKDFAMRVDIYRRPERAGHFSYLAVPESKPIPEEVINTDWEQTDRAVEVDDDAQHLAAFAISDPIAQIQAKGYAITSIKELATEPPHP